jgi:2-phosphosulfolactate phosphatase
MKIKFGSLLPGAQNAKGLAVIIDVFRAFTCAPLLFSLGIKQSILVGSPSDALELKQTDPSLILAGEVGGAPIDGFDFGNSPSQLLRADSAFFKGKTIVQRTSSGVQGALAALAVADEVLLGSYALAKSTAKYILSKNPGEVSLVAMGWNLKVTAPEDECCGRYIAHLLGDGQYDHVQALREIVYHETAQKFLRGDVSYFPAEDPLLCLQRDLYDFVLRAERENDLVIVKKVDL